MAIMLDELRWSKLPVYTILRTTRAASCDGITIYHDENRDRYSIATNKPPYRYWRNLDAFDAQAMLFTLTHEGNK